MVRLIVEQEPANADLWIKNKDSLAYKHTEKIGRHRGNDEAWAEKHVETETTRTREASRTTQTIHDGVE